MKDGPLTEKRKLRDSTPLWLDTPRISVLSRKTIPSTRHDVIIVGGGISGALAAHALADGKRSILILDRRLPVRGSSIASTAMIQHEIDVPLHQLRTMIGKSRADRVWQRSARAVLRLDEIVSSLRLSCSMERKKTLFLAGDELGSRALRSEFEARAEAGIEATLLDGSHVRDEYGIDRTAAILSDISASANPGQLTAGLLRDVRKRGAEIVSGIEVTDLKTHGDEVVLATADGHLLSAGHVVFCTGYEFLEKLGNAGHSIYSTWAISSRPKIALPQWLKSHLVWEASDPYLYFRTTRDGRLIAGGEDEKSPDAYRSDALLRKKSAVIMRKVAELIGYDPGKPDYSWAAAFGSTRTGLPMIGEVPGLKNVYSVMGFGGNGITFSQIAAEIVCAAVGGSTDPDAELFSFD